MTGLNPEFEQLLSSLLGLFPLDGLDLPDLELVSASALPEPYRRLLVHHEHMTEVLEAFHGAKVHLNVLERKQLEEEYARKLYLTAGAGGKVVLLGLMRFRLPGASAEVRRRIIEENAPLGRILIENDVLRWIEPRAYLRVRLGEELRVLFGAPPAATATFGRLAVINVDQQPAVRLLEIVTPLGTEK